MATPERTGGDDRERARAGHQFRQLYAPKALVLLSHYPFYNLYTQFLQQVACISWDFVYRSRVYSLIDVFFLLEWLSGFFFSPRHVRTRSFRKMCRWIVAGIGVQKEKRTQPMRSRSVILDTVKERI